MEPLAKLFSKGDKRQDVLKGRQRQDCSERATSVRIVLKGLEASGLF
jgi:hypothetical protein